MGWNDITVPFKYFINSPLCNPIKLTIGNKIVGVGTTIAHEDTVWLATIIVHLNHRNKGIGNTITQALIDSVKNQFDTIYLDATELGYPIYKKKGFEIETEYVHLKGEKLNFSLKQSQPIVPYRESFMTEILDLDKKISGENREVMLKEEIQNSFVFLSDNKIEGVYFPTFRDGFIIAENSTAGLELMKLRLSKMDFAVLPIDNSITVDFLTKNHFQQYRTSKRMRMGTWREWHPTKLYNRISGQVG